MARQVRDRRGRPAAREIGGARDKHLAHPADALGLQRRIGERPDPHRDVDPFLDDADVAVDQHHPHGKLAVLRHQRADHRQHMQPPEHDGRGQMELPTRFGFGAAQRALGARQLGEDAPRLLQKGGARVGQCDRTRRPVEQPRRQPRLERRDPARHCGR